MAARRRRREVEEEPENHERWLITYADMITLLMVLFIVMFAISEIDKKRFDMLRQGMAGGFGQTASPFQGSDSVLPEAGTELITPIGPVSLQRPSSGGHENAGSGGGAARYDAARAEVERLEGLRRRIEQALERQGLRDDVRMMIDSRGLTISMVSRHIVFAPNVADLTGRGKRVLAVLGGVLRTVDDKVDVDGHTNQVKVKPKFYATDWDLSAARAVTVLRHLNERERIAGRRLSAVAYGHEKPLIDPAHPLSQMLNKRVDVVVLSGADEATRALFDDVLRDRKGL